MIWIICAFVVGLLVGLVVSDILLESYLKGLKDGGPIRPDWELCE